MENDAIEKTTKKSKSYKNKKQNIILICFVLLLAVMFENFRSISKIHDNRK